MSPDRPARRREIEDSTAARLAEIVAAAEEAAKRVIDEAEAEARERLADAHGEADRIVAERLAGLAELTDEINLQAEALRRQAEALQRALAEAKAELGGDASPVTGRRSADLGSDPAAGRPLGPALTVVGEPGGESPSVEERAAAVESQDLEGEVFDGDGPAPMGTPAGARLLATQMAVSGSSRAEIEARLRNGFAISDPRGILDAILGPEQ